MIKHLLLISSLLVSGGVCAIDDTDSVLLEDNYGWMHVGSGQGTGQYLYRFNRNAIVVDGDKIIEFWVKHIATSTANVLSKGDTVVAKTQYNCNKHQSRNLVTVIYKEKFDKISIKDTPNAEYRSTASSGLFPKLAFSLCNGMI